MIRRRAAAVGTDRHQRFQLRCEGNRHPAFCRQRGVGKHSRPAAKPILRTSRVSAWPLGISGSPLIQRSLDDLACTHRCGHKRRAFEQLARDILPGAELRGDLVPPGREAVDPRLDGVFVAAERFDAESRGVAIVSRREHRRLDPCLVPLSAV
jgi:hypothetical protein